MTTEIENGTTLKRMWARLGLGEMQCIVAATVGRDLSGEHLEDILRPQLEDRKSALRQAMRASRCGVSQSELLRKVSDLAPQDLVALQKAVAAIHRQHAPDELFARNRHLPDVSILRKAGLGAPASTPASGFCVILLEDGYHWEQVLRHEPGSLEPADKHSVEESARQAVLLVDCARNEPTEQDNRFVYYACHQIAVKTGWRYFRAQQRGDTVTVVKIDADDLRRDLADGSLAKLSIAGVNAPLPA